MSDFTDEFLTYTRIIKWKGLVERANLRTYWSKLKNVSCIKCPFIVDGYISPCYDQYERRQNK